MGINDHFMHNQCMFIISLVDISQMIDDGYGDLLVDREHQTQDIRT